MLSHLFRYNHKDTAQHETHHYSHRPKEGVLDKIMENETHKASREHGDGQVQKGRTPSTEPVMSIQDEAEFLAIHHQDREDGPQLDKYVKQISQCAFEAQHMAHNNHMAGGGYRDILRQAFYNPYNKRAKIIVHCPTSKNSLQYAHYAGVFPLCCGFSATAILSTFLFFR